MLSVDRRKVLQRFDLLILRLAIDHDTSAHPACKFLLLQDLYFFRSIPNAQVVQCPAK